MSAGSQAWNCYGKRNNRYLMVNYGFCLVDNLYDSHVIHLRLDVPVSLPLNIQTLFAKNVSSDAADIL